MDWSGPRSPPASTLEDASTAPNIVAEDKVNTNANAIVNGNKASIPKRLDGMDEVVY